MANRSLSDGGGTLGGLGQFLVGFIVACVGGYLISNQRHSYAAPARGRASAHRVPQAAKSNEDGGMMANAASSQELPEGASKQRISDSHLLIQLHAAEYNAITTRNTYYMTVSFSFWPALVLYLTLLGLVSGRINSLSLTVSLAAIGSEFLTVGWYFCMVEQYKNVRYLEEKLRLEVAKVLHRGVSTSPRADFWWYESERHPERREKDLAHYRRHLGMSPCAACGNRLICEIPPQNSWRVSFMLGKRTYWIWPARRHNPNRYRKTAIRNPV